MNLLSIPSAWSNCLGFTTRLIPGPAFWVRNQQDARLFEILDGLYMISRDCQTHGAYHYLRTGSFDCAAVPIGGRTLGEAEAISAPRRTAHKAAGYPPGAFTVESSDRAGPPRRGEDQETGGKVQGLDRGA